MVTSTVAVLALRNAKAQKREPHRRGRIEAILFSLEDDLILERVLNPPRGFYARVGGLGEGAGFGGGPGFRYLTPGWTFDASAAASLKGYALGEARLALPGIERDGPFADLYARRRDFPEEDFFGLGPDTIETQRSNFALRETLVRGTGGARIGRLRGGLAVAYLNPSIGRGEDRGVPSVEELFDPSSLPGFSRQPTFTVVEPFVEFGVNPGGVDHESGGHYRLAFSRHEDRDFDRFSFNRWDVEARQYIPFLHRTRNVALHAVVTSTHPDAGEEVPFYLQPTLGGSHSLRDSAPSGSGTAAPYSCRGSTDGTSTRWSTGAVFYDAGAVGSGLDDLGPLERSVGFGFRGGRRDAVGFRLEVAFGGEGVRLLVRFEDVF